MERAGGIIYRNARLRLENSIHGIAGHGFDILRFNNPCCLRNIPLNQRFDRRYRYLIKRDNIGSL